MERRFATTGVRLEERVGTDPPTPTIVGYAARYYDPADAGTEYTLFDYEDERVVERIMRGAFDDWLVARPGDGIDCCALYNHNPDHLLGRQSAGTLVLSGDEKGLRYAITPPDSPLAKGLIASIGRGDLKGSSFSFTCSGDGQRWYRDGRTTVREIHRIGSLPDVGPVVFPAYAGTTTGLRATGDPTEARAAFLAWRAGETEKRERAAAASRARLRLRLAELET